MLGFLETACTDELAFRYLCNHNLSSSGVGILGNPEELITLYVNKVQTATVLFGAVLTPAVLLLSKPLYELTTALIMIMLI
jgi:hypothetical protein